MGHAHEAISANTFKNCSEMSGDWIIHFTINKKLYTVKKDISPAMSLNTFIRDVANLKGTKFMCLEGGCGLCIVAVEIHGEILAVNSCLVPVFLCDGLKITTIEGIGSRKSGYHSLQASLAHLNGTQCGFCSPGMVMNMYSLVQNRKLNKREIEDSFGGNICRCTGYRPILEAFKGFASDAPPQALKQLHDIEELYKIKTCKKTAKECEGKCEDFEYIYMNAVTEVSLRTEYQDSKFYKVQNINEIFSIFQSNSSDSYILNGGNTAHGKFFHKVAIGIINVLGVYPLQSPKLYIDINGILELTKITNENNKLIIGGGVTLSNLKKTLQNHSRIRGFRYLRKLANHIDLIAHVAVRNIGTIAGNLMIKHQHHEFPSDIFLILESSGAKIHILESPSKKIMGFYEFLNLDMRHKLIYSIELREIDNDYVIKTFKIMPRAQNAHAMVNAGFLFKMGDDNKVLEKPNMIFGGIRPDFLHASETEKFLVGKSLSNMSVISKALKILDSELKPDYVLPDTKPQYRKLLAEGLFYKFILGINSENVDEKLKSGESILHRGLSSGTQNYDTDPAIWPVNKPIQKLTAIHQTSGEAEYVNDIPIKPNEVFCAFAIADALGSFNEIDAADAMKIPGVVAFYTAKDIPGENTFIGPYDDPNLFPLNETVFCEKEVLYAGQPYGLIVATTRDIALEAARKVKVIYTDMRQRKAIVTIQDALDCGDKTRIQKLQNNPAVKPPGENVKHVIKGTFEAGSQYHFCMETQSCVCIPLEDGMEIHSSTQSIPIIQNAIEKLLNVKQNSLNLRVRRVGGAYGAKITRQTLIACACALACHILNVPVRFVMSLEDCMKSIGKRYSTLQTYEVGVDDEGVIQYLNSDYLGNSGSSFSEPHVQLVLHHISNCYDDSTWNLTGYAARTDIASNTWCRAPGSCEAIAMAENMMEHIAKITGKNPVEVRLANMNVTDRKALQPIIEELKSSSDYNKNRMDIQSFNAENRWKKRGIGLVCMKYRVELFSAFNALVSIYARDGTVAITHGGIEMGQGIHTKVAQVAAYTLGIDIDMVSVKCTNNLTSPNNLPSSYSIASDSCAIATLKACEELNKRLEPIKARMKDATWVEWVFEANSKNVNLCAQTLFNPDELSAKYNVYGAAVVQVEVDVLTGQHIVARADIIEDVGISLNPLIDVGQAEGAFVMGLGYWTTEELIYDEQTGALANFSTWNYKPPGAKDIPVDFRVTFLRNAPNPIKGVVRSKVIGEPPLCLSYALPLAIRNALDSARADAGNHDAWYSLSGPVTPEKMLLTSLTSKESMII